MVLSASDAGPRTLHICTFAFGGTGGALGSGKLHEAIHGLSCHRWQMGMGNGEPRHSHTPSTSTTWEEGGSSGLGVEETRRRKQMKEGLPTRETRGVGFLIPTVHWAASRPSGRPSTSALSLGF